MFADLHLHSIFSDGTNTPLELCSLAKNNNVKMISGIEISTVYKRKCLHMLVYYIDIFNEQLENFMIHSSEEKTENTRVNFENAISKGVFNYKWERVLELNAGQPRVSVVHVINTMQKD